MAEPIEAFKNAFKIPELKSRIIFTLLMLTIFRLGSHVPVPGVDGSALAAMRRQCRMSRLTRRPSCKTRRLPWKASCNRFVTV